MSDKLSFAAQYHQADRDRLNGGAVNAQSDRSRIVMLDKARAQLIEELDEYLNARSSVTGWGRRFASEDEANRYHMRCDELYTLEQRLKKICPDLPTPKRRRRIPYDKQTATSSSTTKQQYEEMAERFRKFKEEL